MARGCGEGDSWRGIPRISLDLVDEPLVKRCIPKVQKHAHSLHDVAQSNVGGHPWRQADRIVWNMVLLIGCRIDLSGDAEPESTTFPFSALILSSGLYSITLVRT